jgi:hypothetical protein
MLEHYPTHHYEGRLIIAIANLLARIGYEKLASAVRAAPSPADVIELPEAQTRTREKEEYSDEVRRY